MASATLGGVGSTRHLEDSLNVPPEANTPLAPLSYGWVKVCIEAHHDSSVYASAPSYY